MIRKISDMIFNEQYIDALIEYKNYLKSHSTFTTEEEYSITAKILFALSNDKKYDIVTDLSKKIIDKLENCLFFDTILNIYYKLIEANINMNNLDTGIKIFNNSLFNIDNFDKSKVLVYLYENYKLFYDNKITLFDDELFLSKLASIDNSYQKASRTYKFYKISKSIDAFIESIDILAEINFTKECYNLLFKIYYEACGTEAEKDDNFGIFKYVMIKCRNLALKKANNDNAYYACEFFYNIGDYDYALILLKDNLNRLLEDADEEILQYYQMLVQVCSLKKQVKIAIDRIKIDLNSFSNINIETVKNLYYLLIILYSKINDKYNTKKYLNKLFAMKLSTDLYLNLYSYCIENDFANELVKALINKKNKNNNLNFKLAKLLIITKEYQKALKYCDDIKTKDNHFLVLIYIAKALIYANNQNYKEAILVSHKALEIKPIYYGLKILNFINLILSYCHLKLGNISEASVYLYELIRLTNILRTDTEYTDVIYEYIYLHFQIIESENSLLYNFVLALEDRYESVDRIIDEFATRVYCLEFNYK